MLHFRNYPFKEVHVEGSRRLARIAREMGVQRFIQVSAMNANLNPPEFFIPGGSQFLKSKVRTTGAYAGIFFGGGGQVWKGNNPIGSAT